MSAETVVIFLGAFVAGFGFVMMLSHRDPKPAAKPRPLYAQGWRIARYPGCITCEGAEEAGQLILHQRRDHRSVYYEEF